MNASTQSIPSNRLPCLILGIGNDFRGDDGFGLSVAYALRKKLRDIPIKLSRGDASELLDYFDQTDCLILIDAIYDPDATPGTCQHFNMAQARTTADYFRSSTHLVSISEAIALGRLYDRLPQQLHLFGVAAQQFDPGSSLSPEIEAAIEPTCDRITTLIKELSVAPTR